MHTTLQRHGVRVDRGWVAAAEAAGVRTEEEIFVQFVMADLREANTTAALPDLSASSTLAGPWVLQVEAWAGTKRHGAFKVRSCAAWSGRAPEHPSEILANFELHLTK